MEAQDSKLIFFVSVSLISLVGCYQGDEADLIIHNATIYSCDENFTTYEAMAVRDGKILQLGPNREILNGYDCDHIIDAELKAVFPGFHDAHCHFQSYANQRSEVHLAGCGSFEEMVERVVAFDRTNNLPFITGRGWDQTKWEDTSFPVNDTFNILFPDKPVLLRRVDGHAAMANAVALMLAGITNQTEISGGMIGQTDGNLNGLIMDNAFDTVAYYFPMLSIERQLENLSGAEYELFQVGLTSINDAGIESRDRENWIRWYRNGDLRIKNYSMLFPDADNMEFATDNGIYQVGNLVIRSFKLVADGAMGSRGACLLAEYSDSAGYMGFMLRSESEMREIAALAKEINYQLNTHCIGDSAVRTMLKIYADVVQDESDHRWKIEHAQLVDSADFHFFRDINIIPSVQPTHCTSDMPWLEQRIGKHRAKFAYAWKTLIQYAGKLPLGTDFPVEDISPLKTFYAAITRQDAEGNPVGGFYPGELLTRREALLGITLWPAWSNFAEGEKGSLEAGKSADFVILTKDIMKIAPKEILSTFVERTFLDGDEVYFSE